MGETDAAVVVEVTFVFVGVTEVDVEEVAAGTATFGEEVEVEAATGTVAKVEVEAGTAVLEVRVNLVAETAMFEEELGDARSLA